MDIINDPFNKMILGGSLIKRRQFLTFGGVNEYGEIPAWTATGDFEVTFDVTPSLDDFQLAGMSNANWFGFTTGGEVTVKVNNSVSNSSGAGITADGKMHAVSMSRTSGTLSVKWDGVEVISAAKAGNFVLDMVGAANGPVQFHIGVISNLRLTDTAGGDNRFYPMSGGRSGSGAYELDQLATMGADVWTGLTVNSPWVDNGGNNYTIDGSQVGNTSVTTSPGQSTGTPMLFSVTVNSKSGVGSLFLGASGNLIDVSTVQAYDVLIVSGGDLASVDVIAEAGVTADITVTSVRAAPNAMTINNIISTDWEKFTQVGADWLGGELVVNGGFNTDLTGWTSSNATVAGGKVTYTAAGFVFQDMASAINNPVLVAADAVGGTTPQLTVGISTNALGRFQHNGSLGDTLDNVSVKRILKAP